MKADPGWDEIADIFDRAMTLPPEEREPYLRSAANDEQTYRSIIRLVQAAEYSTGFMLTAASRAPADASLFSGERVGAWEIIDPLGSGGMGEVYRVRRADGHYEQQAALKLIRGDIGPPRERFNLERSILARLEHPNIARLIDGGEAPDGRLFMVVEEVEGVPIDDYAAQNDLDANEILQLILQVCAALSHAHSRLVLHRDIKPSNILVTHDGHVRLIDFGVAAIVSQDTETDLSAPLTLAYSAPEQFKGEAVSASTDIFALACTLFQLLTGAPPPRGEEHAVTLPSEGLNRELRAILMRALNTDPELRYRSADALAADIERLLNDQPVEAVGGGSGYRVTKFLQRYKVGTGLAALLVLSLATGLTASLVFAGKAEQEAERAQLAAEEAEAQADDANWQAQFSEAKSNALQQVFGASPGDDDYIDPQIVRNSLLRLGREAVDVAEESPYDASFTLLAIGQTFLFRNDYPAAIEVLEPLVELEIGDDETQSVARALLARAFLTVERKTEAAALIRKSITYRETQDPYSAEHASSASYLAVATGAEKDREEALRILAKAIERDERDNDGQITPFLYNETGFHNYQMGRLDEATLAFQKSVDALRRVDPLGATGNDTHLLNLGKLYLYHGEDVESARALFEEVETINTQIKGASNNLGSARLYLAEIALIDNDPEAALDLAEEAMDALMTYSEGRSSEYPKAMVMRNRALARLGRMEEAQAGQAELLTLKEGWSNPDQLAMEHAYAQGFIALAADDMAALESQRGEISAMAGGRDELGLGGRYYMRRFDEALAANQAAP